MSTPYIGITDFIHPDHVHRMREVYRRAGGSPASRLLHIGTMTSFKVLNGMPSKWTPIFLPPELLWTVFLPYPDVLNTLHYADFEGNNLLPNITRATLLAGPNLHALQLDMVWPNPSEIKNYRSSYPAICVIIQINTGALEKINNDAKNFVARIREYENSIDYVLLDKSMGRGLGMDAMALLPFLKALADNFPNIGIATAGGLGPNTLHFAEPLIKEFPNISIDAQGKLRPSGNATDPVDWNMAELYLTRALQMFQKYH